MDKESPFDIAIIGFGPTGATLANLLGQWRKKDSIRILVVEHFKAVYSLPRAVHFDDETMRIFQSCGLADKIQPLLKINKGMQFRDKDGNMILDWPRPQTLTTNGWNASYRFHQPEVESVLTSGTSRFENVTVRRGTKVLSIKEDADAVFLKCQTDEGECTFMAKYVVGCDGARSLTRAHIAKETGQPPWEDLGFMEKWLVVDLLIRVDIPELGEHTVQTCNPERPTTYCCGPGRRRRWEIAIKSEDEDILSPEVVWNFVGPFVTPENADIERKTVYEFESKVARRWRSKRCFIAGDAAHLTPPFMGQGMCTGEVSTHILYLFIEINTKKYPAGIRDASNLAWKLALSIDKSAHETDFLLGSYQTERRPHARAYVETAMRLGALMNTCETAEELKNTLQPSKKEDGAKMSSIKPDLGPGLGTGIDRQIAPQFCNDSGVFSDDAVGYDFVLLALSKWVAPWMLRHNQFIVLTEKDFPDVGKYLYEKSINGMLIRPDRYPIEIVENEQGLRDVLTSLFSDQERK
eukprot:UC4_evm3s186